MQVYKDLNGDSGVSGFESGEGYITVFFQDGTVFIYTDVSAGSDAVTKMQRLAATGDGLPSYIQSNVRDDYAQKLR